MDAVSSNDCVGSPKENLKFTIGARNYKNYTTIGGRSALDLRAEVCVCGAWPWWCDLLMKKAFPLSPWSNRSFQTNFKSQWSLIALRAMRGAPLARFRSNSACVQCQWQHFAFLLQFSFHVRLKWVLENKTNLHPVNTSAHCSVFTPKIVYCTRLNRCCRIKEIARGNMFPGYVASVPWTGSPEENFWAVVLARFRIDMTETTVIVSACSAPSTVYAL
jgi:hypothetical protein